MDTDIVVFAPVVCKAKQVDLQISELPGLCGDIGSGPGKTFLEPRDMLDVPDGLRGPRRHPEISRTRLSPLVWLILGRVHPCRSSGIS